MKQVLSALIAALCFSVATATATNAHAATTVYVDSSDPIYAGLGFAPASNAGESLNAPDGNSAFVPLGGFIAYLVSPLFTVVDFDMEFTGVTGAGTVRLYVGRTDGTGGFTSLNSAFFTVTDGSNNLSSTALSNFCVTLGGCDTYVVQAWTGTTFGIDSAIAAAPEPQVWAMFIIGFVVVAWRLKSLRYQNRRLPLGAMSADAA